MKWSEVGKDVAEAAPVIGTLLRDGAAVAAVGSIVAAVLAVDATPQAVARTIKRDPAALAKLHAVELEHRDKLIELQVNAANNAIVADTRRIQAGNGGAGATAEHWAEWLWRPLNGLLFAPTVLALYVILPAIHVHVPDVPVIVWEAWGALLGITAWRGEMKQRLEAADRPAPRLQVGAVMSKIRASRTWV